MSPLAYAPAGLREHSNGTLGPLGWGDVEVGAMSTNAIGHLPLSGGARVNPTAANSGNSPGCRFSLSLQFADPLLDLCALGRIWHKP